MPNLTRWFQILVILILFSEISFVGGAEPSGTVLDKKNTEEELHHEKVKIMTLERDNPEQEYSKTTTDECGMETIDHLSRHKHSTSVKNVSAPQRKQLCGHFEHQPCTCYYPDHPNVIRFELETDEITQNAANDNGTGPASCEDLQSIGYKLAGFYMVRFKPKRVKAIYCSFVQTLENLSHSNQATQSYFEQGDPGSSQMVQFCNGLASQPCTFLYTDYPDIPLLRPKKNKTIATNNVSLENNISGPTNCGDLKFVGHKFKGFYIIRQNALKVKIIYCDFSLITEKFKEIRTKRPALNNNGDELSKNTKRVCKGVGSQPCSCYYSNFPEILQFELSNDETTSNAIQKNGTGPLTCEELQNFGHTLNGFYFLRLNNTAIKTAYCKLNATKKKPKKKKKPNNELTTIRTEPTSTFLEINTEMPTTIKKKKNRPKCDANYYIFLLKNENSGYCLKVVKEDSISLFKCNYSSPGQHWTRPRLLGLSAFASWTHICLAYSDQCLTFALSPKKAFAHDLFLKPFYSHEYVQQKWVISDNGQLVSMSNGLRLVARLNIFPLNPSYNTANKWRFEMEAFTKEPLHKWSFLPVQDNNNVTLCAKN